MKFLSLFSGIEACSQAWHPLGWECVGVAEIEPFACELLKQRYPDVPNLGDVSQLTDEQLDGIERPDLIIFGSPCQSFSQAGRRLGLNDPRGNLAIVALGLVAKLRPKYFIWENVPGVLSSVTDGQPDFGAFLGTVRDIGDYACAWRIIDAQFARTCHFPQAVAQRRRRLFVVGCAGEDWRSAAAILSLPQGLQGDTAPSRKKGEGVAGNAEDCAGGDSRTGAGELRNTRSEPSGAGEACQGSEGGRGSNVAVVDGVRRTVHTTMESNDVSQSLSWREYKGMSCGRDGLTSPAVVEEPVPYSIMTMNSGKDYKAREAEVAQPVMTQPIGGNQGGDYVVDKAIGFQSNGNTDDMMAAGDNVSPTVRVGSGRGSGMPPAAAYPIQDQATRHAGKRGDKSDGKGNGLGVGDNGDPSFTLTRGDHHAVAFDTTQVTNKNNRSNPQPGDPVHTLGRDSHPPLIVDGVPEVSKALKANSGGIDREDMHTIIPTYPIDSRNAGRDPEKHDAMNRQGVGVGDDGDPAHTVTSSFVPAAATNISVRRLTPEECEELQGMERGWTRIAWKGKAEEDCPDGPRYKAIGNSMAVNVMQWIGERIQLVEDIKLGIAIDEELPW